MKKVYVEPSVKMLDTELEEMIAATRLDPNGGDTQTISPSDKEYDDVFGAKQQRSVWDD